MTRNLTVDASTPPAGDACGADPLARMTERGAMVAATRRLAEAVGRSGLDGAGMLAAAEAIAAIADELAAEQLDQVPRIAPQAAVGQSDYSWQLHNPAHPGLVMHIDENGVRASVASTVGSLYEGPDGLLHGGVAAMLLDSALSSLVQHHGMECVTASLKVDFRKPTPLRRPLEITATLGGEAGRKVTVCGEIRCDGEVTVEATALCIRLVG